MSEKINIAFLRQDLAELTEVCTYKILLKRKNEFKHDLRNRIKKHDELKDNLDKLIAREHNLQVTKKSFENSFKLNLQHYADLEKQLIEQEEKNAKIYLRYEEAINRFNKIHKKNLECYKRNPLAIEYQRLFAKVTCTKIQIKITRQKATEQKQKNKQRFEIKKKMFQTKIINLATSAVDRKKSELLAKKLEVEKEQLVNKIFELTIKNKKLDEQKEKRNTNIINRPTKKVLFATTNEVFKIPETSNSTNYNYQKPDEAKEKMYYGQFRPSPFAIPLRSQNPKFLELLNLQRKPFMYKKTCENLSSNKLNIKSFDTTVSDTSLKRKEETRAPSLDIENEVKAPSPKKQKVLKSIISGKKNALESMKKTNEITSLEKEQIASTSKPCSKNTISTNDISLISTPTNKKIKIEQENLKPKIIDVKVVKPPNLKSHESNDDNNTKQHEVVEPLENCVSTKEHVATPYPTAIDASEYSDELISQSTNQNQNESSEISSSYPTQENSLPIKETESEMHSKVKDYSETSSYTSPTFDFLDFENESSHSGGENTKNVINTESEKKPGFRLFAGNNENETDRSKTETKLPIGFGQKQSAPKKSPGFFSIF